MPNRSDQVVTEKLPKGSADQVVVQTDQVLWRVARHLPFFNRMVAQREQSLARACCAEMLTILNQIQAQEPALRDEALYTRAITRRLACDMAQAREIVRMADVSFAQWPEERDVRYRDVVKYLIVHQILGRDAKSMGAQSDIDRIVRDSIPQEL
jgi:hypothetical protein